MIRNAKALSKAFDEKRLKDKIIKSTIYCAKNYGVEINKVMYKRLRLLNLHVHVNRKLICNFTRFFILAAENNYQVIVK